MEYREYRQGDEGELNDLYNIVFERDRTIDQWKWEYIDTPGRPSKIVVVEDEGKVIAHEAMIPMLFHVFDREVLGGKIEDAYIDKKYRGQKLFGPLTEYCIDVSVKDGYEITFGLTARPVNYQLHVTRGYHHICSLNAFFAVFAPGAVTDDISRVIGASSLKKTAMRTVLSVLSKRFKTRIAQNADKPDSCRIERIERFDERFDRLWEEFIAAKKTITLKRSSDFLNWRYVDIPYRDYAIFAAVEGERVLGYLIAGAVNRPDEGIEVLLGTTPDFLVLPGHESVYEPLVRHAVEYWRSQNVSMVISWVHRDSEFARPLVSELKRIGLVSSFGRYDIPVLVLRLAGDFDKESFYAESGWHVTQAFGGCWV